MGLGGFLKKVAAPVAVMSAISKPLGSIGLLNAAVTGSPGGVKDDDEYGVPQPPQIDPRLGQMRDNQFKLAQDFRTNSAGLQNQALTGAEDEAKQTLAQKRMDIARGANSRGLLYSGLKTQAEGQAGAQAGAELSGRRRKIADSFEEQQQQLDQAAFDSGSRMQALEQARYDTIYKNQLAAQQAQAKDQTSPLGILGAPFRALGLG